MPTQAEHVEVEEQPRMSVSDAEGPYQDVQPKTYQILEREQAAGIVPLHLALLFWNKN